jgi:SM-20-related protein
MRRSLARFATAFATRQAPPSRVSLAAVARSPVAKPVNRPIAVQRTSADQPHSAGAASPILDLETVRSARLQNHPFEYLIAANFIRPEWQDRLIEDYPIVKKGGSFPLSTVKVGADFARLIAEMNGAAFRQIVEQTFSLRLDDRPTMFTVRGHCRRKDGKIHTDAESKIITVLLYMNPAWADSGGRLRILNSGTNIDDFAAELPPTFGTLLIFRRCGHSFHGHLPFEGARRVIQMNWVTEQKYVDREVKRHRWSALIKSLGT